MKDSFTYTDKVFVAGENRVYLGDGTHTREERVLISSIPTGLKIGAEMILGFFQK